MGKSEELPVTVCIPLSDIQTMWTLANGLPEVYWSNDELSMAKQAIEKCQGRLRQLEEMLRKYLRYSEERTE